MTYMNGAAATDSALLPPVTAQVAMQTAKFTPARLAEIKAALEEPFDPSEIKWRVTATTTVSTKHGPRKRGQVIAYADQRAYTDRLNATFGEWGWTRGYDVQVVQNFERKSRSDKTQSAVAAKVVVVARVAIHDLGTHSGVGEEWADDENAATRAEAQAFKRGCACFGLGRYLYDLDSVWVDLDQYNRPVETPRLPDWAIPGYAQREAERIKQHAAASRGATPRQSLVREEVLSQIRGLCAEIGHSLSQFVVKTYGGVGDPSKVGFAKLTTVLEKLSDTRNGVARLNRAAAAVGAERYATICRELGLASESVDDIPSRDALRGLLTRVEQVVASQQPATNGAASRGICVARGRLLQTARKAAEYARSGWPRKLGDVIAQASGGRITLETLSALTDRDVDVVESVIATIEGNGR